MQGDTRLRPLSSSRSQSAFYWVTMTDKEKAEDNLLSLLDVETFLEQADTEQTQCKYFEEKGVCPYQEVGCMFKHQEEGEQGGEVNGDKKQDNTKERLSARSRNRKINEDRFRRMRDLSISCS